LRGGGEAGRLRYAPGPDDRARGAAALRPRAAAAVVTPFVLDRNPARSPDRAQATAGSDNRRIGRREPPLSRSPRTPGMSCCGPGAGAGTAIGCALPD